MCSSSILLSVLIVVVSDVGNYMAFESVYAQEHAFQISTDLLLHAILAGMSAAAFLIKDTSLSREAVLYNICLAITVSSTVDLDMLFSFTEQSQESGNGELTCLEHGCRPDRLQASYRGVLHSTPWCGVLCIVAIALAVSRRHRACNLCGFVCLVALSAHHTRDASRAGYSLWPLESTETISWPVYLTLIAVLPHLYYYIYRDCKTYIESSQSCGKIVYENV